MDVGRFLCGIAAIIYDPRADAYLLLQRSQSRDAGGDNWECVTGRVNQGESFETALHREVREELGVPVRIDFIVGTSHFFRGQAMPENELLGVKYACTLDNPDAVRLSDEHQAARWLRADEVYAFLPADHWLHQSIRRAENLRKALPDEVISQFQAWSLEDQ